jgi:mono/diheme cytochrome c family protein
VTALSLQAQSSTRDGVYTPAQAERGKTAYNKECAACHSETLEGGGQAPPLAGADFVGNWAGQPLAELFDKMQSSMPADKPGQLSRATNADILAYLLSASRFPPGKTELPTAADGLKKIRLEKP